MFAFKRMGNIIP